MATLEELVLKLKVDGAAAFKSELEGAERLTRQVGDSHTDMEGKSSGSLSKLIPSWKAVATAITGAAVAMGAAGLKIVQLAADADATVSKFNVVFGEGSTAATQWADDISKATGRNKYDIMETTSTFQAMLVGMGMTREEAAKTSESYTQLSLDMAAFYNTSDEDAAQAIKSGIAGETEGLKRYGIILTEAAVQEELVAMKGGDMAAAIAAAGDDPEKLEMVRKQFDGIAKGATDAEKQQARYNLIQKATGDIQGQQAREAGGYQEQMKRMFATLKQGATDAGKSAMESMTGVFTSINQILSGGGLDLLSKIFAGIADGVAWVLQGALKLGAAFASWGNNGGFAILKEFAGSVLKNLQVMLSGTIKYVQDFAGSGGLGRLSEAAKIVLQGMVKLSDYFREVGVYKAFGNTLEGIVRVIIGIIDVIARVIIWVRNLYVAFNTAYQQISSGTQGIRSVISSVFNAISSVISSVINTIKNVISAAWNYIRGNTTSSMDGVRNAISSVWNAIRTVITTVINVIRTIITSGWAAIRSAVVAAGSAIQSATVGAWNSIRNAITSAMNTIRSVVVAAWNTIRSLIVSAMTAIVSAISGGWTRAVSAIRTGVNNAVAAVTGAARSFYNAGANLISNLISGVTSKISELKQKVAEATSLSSIGSSIKSTVSGISGGSSGGSSGKSTTGNATAGTKATQFGSFYSTPTRISLSINNKAADVSTTNKIIAKSVKVATKARTV